jgi:NADPH:quinone reductase-like Zn-dependent oxidoreductase
LAASTEEKRSFARAEGADASIDYTDEKWREALKSLTNGQPIDVILMPSATTYRQLHSARSGGGAGIWSLAYIARRVAPISGEHLV